MFLPLYGNVTQPEQPSFLATHPDTQTDVTGDNTSVTVTFSAEVFDQGADYNTGTYTFTAPVTGKYLFTTVVRIQGLLTGHTSRTLTLVTSNRTNGIVLNRSLAEPVGSMQFSAIFDMDANDTAYVQLTVEGSTKVIDILGNTTYNEFSGSLIN
jgi:hypothetical protein